ncbi:MAG: ASCH domain-containing protein [Luteitalea sp.]|nr:ASCH domain-containing protein [Luteitalea sp.]
MRRMSFSHAASEVRAGMKTVTRRLGWRFLKPNELIQAVDKAPGSRSAGPVRRLAILRVQNVRVEPLARLIEDARYAEDELPREGFPCWSRDDFIARFLRRHRLTTTAIEVTRIEFEYVEPVPTSVDLID